MVLEWERDPTTKARRYALVYLKLAADRLRELGHENKATIVETIRDDIDVEGIYKVDNRS